MVNKTRQQTKGVIKMKIKFNFVEKNSRLNEVKRRTKTLEMSKELVDTFNVTGMMKEFKIKMSSFIFHDSDVAIKKIRAGRYEFQVNENIAF